MILRKERHIVPMQITEEIIRKTLSGQEKSYKVAYGPKDEQEEILLSHLDGEVFESLAAVQQELLRRAAASIDNLIDAATKRSADWFDSVGNEEKIQENVAPGSDTKA